jgi:hypothetical protein
MNVVLQNRWGESGSCAGHTWPMLTASQPHSRRADLIISRESRPFSDRLTMLSENCGRGAEQTSADLAHLGGLRQPVCWGLEHVGPFAASATLSMSPPNFALSLGHVAIHSKERATG